VTVYAHEWLNNESATVQDYLQGVMQTRDGSAYATRFPHPPSHV